MRYIPAFLIRMYSKSTSLLSCHPSAFVQLWHFPTAKYLIHDWQGAYLIRIGMSFKHWTMIILMNTSQYIWHKCQGIILVIKLQIQVMHIAPFPIPQRQKMVDFECPSGLRCNAMIIRRFNAIDVALAIYLEGHLNQIVAYTQILVWQYYCQEEN